MLPKRFHVALKDSLAVNSVFNYSMYYSMMSGVLNLIDLKKCWKAYWPSMHYVQRLCTVHSKRLSQKIYCMFSTLCLTTHHNGYLMAMSWKAWPLMKITKFWFGARFSFRSFPVERTGLKFVGIAYTCKIFVAKYIHFQCSNNWLVAHKRMSRVIVAPDKDKTIPSKRKRKNRKHKAIQKKINKQKIKRNAH